MSDDQFTKLFKYLENWFDEVDQRFEKVEKSNKDIKFSITKLVTQLKEYRQELLLITRREEKI